VDCADEIAYLCADLEDGLRAGILEKNDFDFVPQNSIDFLVRDIAEQGLQKLESLQKKSENGFRHFYSIGDFLKSKR